jgi:hypothetical protein
MTASEELGGTFLGSAIRNHLLALSDIGHRTSDRER